MNNEHSVMRDKAHCLVSDVFECPETPSLLCRDLTLTGTPRAVEKAFEKLRIEERFFEWPRALEVTPMQLPATDEGTGVCSAKVRFAIPVVRDGANAHNAMKSALVRASSSRADGLARLEVAEIAYANDRDCQSRA